MKVRAFVMLFLSIFIIHSSFARLVAKSPLEQIAENRSKINLNQVDAKTLAGSFKRIGKKRAEAIVEYRNSHGYFRSILELARVKGISLNFVKKHLHQLESVYTV